MTLYKKRYLNNRVISDGTYEALCCEAWGEPTQVQIFTDNSGKWDWLNFLGLTTTPQRRVYIQQEEYDWEEESLRKITWNRPAWMFHTVKLVPFTDNDEWYAWAKPYHAEMSHFRTVCYRGSIQTCDLNEFTILRPAIEYLRKRGKTHGRPDAHQYNWLKCPITGVVFPYDVMHIPYLGD